MKKILILCIILAIASVSCKKGQDKPADENQPDAGQEVALGKRYAALSISIKSEQDLSSKASAYLFKTEEVTLLEELKGTKDGKEVDVLKVETVDGKTGYQEARYFGIQAIVITSEKAPVYKKNSIQSSVIHNLMNGTVAVVTQQMGEWYEIIAYELPEKSDEQWQKWIREGSFSSDLSMVTDFYKLEKVKYNLLRVGVDKPEQLESLKKAALPELENLVSNSSVSAVSAEAKKYIEYIETGYLPEGDEGSQDKGFAEGSEDDSSDSGN